MERREVLPPFAPLGLRINMRNYNVGSMDPKTLELFFFLYQTKKRMVYFAFKPKIPPILF